MSKKFSAARKRAFLAYLAQTGNQTLSAEKAKVSRSWVCLHRSTDAEFDAACREALREAKERLKGPLSPALSREGRGRYHDGHELVVSGSNGRWTQVRRARLKQWTPRVEARFLAALAETCNVSAACAEVGMWPPSAYNHRKRWRAFAQAWDAAIEDGYARIEAALLKAGCNLHSRWDDEAEADGPELAIREMTADHAIHILHMHKKQARGIGKAPGLPPRIATPAEAEAALKVALRRLNALIKVEGAKSSKQDVTE